jgi:hypothetical protein
MWSRSVVDPVFLLDERLLEDVPALLILLVRFVCADLLPNLYTYFHPTGSVELQTAQKMSQTVCSPVVRAFRYSLPFVMLMLDKAGIHRVKEVRRSVLSSEGLWDQLPQRAQMRIAPTANEDIVALQKFHKDLRHYYEFDYYAIRTINHSRHPATISTNSCL